MKREGRQHGMVRTCMDLPPPWNSRPNSKVVNKLTSPPTAGQYTKVPAKPTNHSKFTGKCGTPRCVECHTRPACKSREKSKGTQKLKYCDVALDHRLITRMRVDKRVGLINVGGSATGILGHLIARNWDEVNGEMEDVVDGVGADSSSAWQMKRLTSGTMVDGDDDRLELRKPSTVMRSLYGFACYIAPYHQ